MQGHLDTARRRAQALTARANEQRRALVASDNTEPTFEDLNPFYIAMGLRPGEARLAILIDGIDRAKREGWLACCKAFRDYNDDFIDSIVGDVEAKVPGDDE